MVVKEIIVKNSTGLQSKSAAVFIQKASLYKSNIWIEKDERKANAKSLLGVLSLSIGCGSRVVVSAAGEDEEKAAEELGNFLKTEG
ncbi:MAG: HPr family phosphocarrier protein [Clostridiales bacterium]|nr:HPr family phosphocarrier protein [Clostridiales bacterium]